MSEINYKSSLLSNESIYPELYYYAKYLYLDILTKEEKEVLAKYTSNDYLLINSKLRNIINYNINNMDHKIELIDNALSKFNLNTNLKVYRKIYIYGDLLKYINTIEKQGFIIDNAYQSTSLKIDGFNVLHNVLLEIDITKTNVGALINYLSLNNLEEEFLIKRNIKMDIVDLNFNKDNYVKIKTRI